MNKDLLYVRLDTIKKNQRWNNPKLKSFLDNDDSNWLENKKEPDQDSRNVFEKKDN